MPSTLSGAARGAVAIAAGCALLSAPSAGAQSLDYTQTDFAHGLASAPAIWQKPYGELNGSAIDYLAARVPLGGVTTPAFNPGTTTFTNQVDILSDVVYYQNGRHVVVGHSLGSLVARGTYLGLGTNVVPPTEVRAGVAGIIAIAAPHQGAVIADSVDKAVGFLLDVQRRVNDGVGAVRLSSWVIGGLLGALTGGVIGGVAGGITAGTGALYGGLFGVPAYGLFIAYQARDAGISIGEIQGITRARALPDLSPNSAAIWALNSNTADAAIPRANIVGRIPAKDALLRLSAALQDQSEADVIGKKRSGMLGFRICKYGGYATLIMSRSARRCGFAIRVLDRVDDTWVRYTSGTEDRGGRQVARIIPSDGIVPNERSRYPGLSDPQFDPPAVDGANHQNIYRRGAALDRVVSAMQGFGMVSPRPAPPPRPRPAEPLRLTVSGPMSLYTGVYGSWSATVTGGVPPYAYAWNPDVQGDGAYASAVFSSPGWYYATLTVTDAAGTQTSGGVGVYVAECTDPYACQLAQRVRPTGRASTGRPPAPRGSVP